jgi:hypothetical protein
VVPVFYLKLDDGVEALRRLFRRRPAERFDTPPSPSVG